MADANDFMRRRHAAFSTPDAVLFDLVARATRCQPIRSERIVQGYDNEVYAVETDDGASFIVRLHRFGEVSLTQEAWALEQCRRQAVPVPEVLGLETLTMADGHREVMVQRRLPGRPLSAILPSLGPGERARVLFRAGEALRGIHTINVGGYYRRRDDGSWDFPSRVAVAKSAMRHRAAEAPQLLTHLSAVDVARMLEILSQQEHEARGEQPVLCHGDFVTQHIFVTEGLALCGIIDFGEFQGGAPIHDLAYLALEQPDLPMAPLLAGYDDARVVGPVFADQLRRYQIGLGMGYLAHYVGIGNDIEARRVAARLKAVLRATPD